MSVVARRTWPESLRSAARANGSRTSEPGVGAAVGSGAFALPALEGPVERGVAPVADVAGHGAGRIVALAQQPGRLGHAPSAEVFQRRLADQGGEAGGESRPREPDRRRQLLDGPRLGGPL